MSVRRVFCMLQQTPGVLSYTDDQAIEDLKKAGVPVDA